MPSQPARISDAQSRMLDLIELGEPVSLDHRSQRTFDVLVREALVTGQPPYPALTERGRVALYSGEIPDERCEH